DAQVVKGFFTLAQDNFFSVLDDPAKFSRKKKNFKHEHIWHSKYGNLRKILRLDPKSVRAAACAGNCVNSEIAGVDMMKINTATTLSKQTTSKPAMITGATSSTTTNGTTTTHTSEDLTITTNKIPLPLL
ncbi:unnamed protein product, partial [Amoebophrya sp. A120]